MTDRGDPITTLDRRRFLIGLGATGTGLVLAACAPTASGPASVEPTAAIPQVLVSKERADFGTADPALVNSNGDFNVEQNIADPLVRFKPGTTELMPALAERWDVSSDNLSYTFHLRKGVKWQKGFGDFTARDVVYSFTRIMDPKTASPYLSYVAPVKAVDALDDYTVRVTLKTPYPGIFEAMLTYRPGFIANEKAITQFGAAYKQNPIGTGPYMVDKITAGVEWTLVRNPDFWGPAPTLDRITYKLIKDEQVAALALQKGELDVAYFESPEQQLKVRTMKELTVMEGALPRTFYMTLNMQRPPLDNPKVRQALAWATNKKGLVDSVFLGQAEVANSIIPPSVFGHVNTEVYGYDLNKAKQLLAEAGFPNGFPGQTFQFITYDTAPLPDVLQVIQADWAKIGYQTKVEVMDLATYDSRRRANTFDVEAGSVLRVEASQFTVNYLHSRSIPFPNTNAYRGADDLLDRAQTEPDATKRKALYTELTALLEKDLPQIPLLYPKQVLAMQPKVKGAAVGLLTLPLWQMSIGKP